MSIDIAHEASFRILTSLRWTYAAGPSDFGPKGQPEESDDILHLHRERFLESAKALEFGGLSKQLDGERGLKLLRTKIQDHLSLKHGERPSFVSTYKIRVAIARSGDFDVSSLLLESIAITNYTPSNLIPRSLAESTSNVVSCVVYVDSAPIEPSVFTRHKTTYRQPYDEARSRVEILNAGPTQAEVLIWNSHGEVMEASLCTPYFLRVGGWITPRAESGGNIGVSRTMAISKGICKEGIVMKRDLMDGEIIWLSNAVRGFFRGRVSLTGIADSVNT
ncbi:MAG: hypothetical protein Q9227_006724 [Pyrenula ochraceoflavens]